MKRLDGGAREGFRQRQFQLPRNFLFYFQFLCYFVLAYTFKVYYCNIAYILSTQLAVLIFKAFYWLILVYLLVLFSNHCDNNLYFAYSFFELCKRSILKDFNVQYLVIPSISIINLFPNSFSSQLQHGSHLLVFQTCYLIILDFVLICLGFLDCWFLISMLRMKLSEWVRLRNSEIEKY